MKKEEIHQRALLAEERSRHLEDRVRELYAIVETQKAEIAKLREGLPPDALKMRDLYELRLKAANEHIADVRSAGLRVLKMHEHGWYDSDQQASIRTLRFVLSHDPRKDEG